MGSRINRRESENKKKNKKKQTLTLETRMERLAQRQKTNWQRTGETQGLYIHQRKQVIEVNEIRAGKDNHGGGRRDLKQEEINK